MSSSRWNDSTTLGDGDSRMAGMSFSERVKQTMDEEDTLYTMPTTDTLVSETGMDFGDLEQHPPTQQLMRHWLNERGAPEILQCQHQLLNQVLDLVAEQSSLVNRLRSDPDTSEEEHFQIMLVQTEIERVKFVARGYLRARLFKIEQHAAYIMTHSELHGRLSSTELRHAQRYANLIGNQFRASVLSTLPSSTQALDDDLSDTGIPPMITEPYLKKPVFIRALKNCGEVSVGDGHTLTISAGSIHLLPYEAIQALVLAGDLELL